MKLLKNEIINQENAKFVLFELTQQERDLLSPAKIKEILFALDVPQPDLAIRFSDSNQMLVNVDEVLKEKLVNSLLVQLAAVRLLKLKEANDMLKSVCELLKVEFRDLRNEAQMVCDKQCANALLARFSALASTPKPAPAKPNEQNFGSGLTGLKGAFLPK